MPEELIQFNARKPATSVMTILFLIIATYGSYCAVRWYLGDTLAEYFNTDESSLRMAQLATALAPSDPLPHWRLADISQKKKLEQVTPAIKEYEEAVSLSPNDYRFWMELGTALEHSGDIGRGEQALRQAVALAPSYSNPHWYLGNLLLRSSKYDEAFAELRLASDEDPELRPQLFSLVWQVYNPDFESLKSAVGTTEARASFSLYLVGQGKFEDGLRLWNSLNEADKKANSATGNLLVSTLIGAQRFHDAMNVWNDLAPSESYRATLGKVVDGGFEEDITRGPEMIFGWQVKQSPQMKIGIDPAKAHSGARSLQLLFQVRSRLESINVSQMVPVTAETQYDFECYVKTEKLQSGSTPIIQLADAANGAVLAYSGAAPNGDSDWQRIAVSLKTGAKTEAVIIRIVRASCEDTDVCPIFGVVWYDDFNFKRRN